MYDLDSFKSYGVTASAQHVTEALLMAASPAAGTAAGSPISVLINNPSTCRPMAVQWTFTGREVLGADNSNAQWGIDIWQRFVVNGVVTPVTGEANAGLYMLAGTAMVANINTNGYTGSAVIPPGASYAVTAYNVYGSNFGGVTPGALFNLESGALSIVGVSA
jgi:hypothetical protein